MGFFGGVGASIKIKRPLEEKKSVGSGVVLREDELLFTFSVVVITLDHK